MDDKDQKKPDDIHGLTPEENLKADNELKALNLDLEYGGISHIADDTPPEVVSAFLDRVKNFEEQHNSAPKITVCARLGNPVVKSYKDLTTEDCQEQVDKFTKLMKELGLVLLLPEHFNAIGKYRFLVNDVLDHEITDYTHEHMIQTIDYDDFHHDGPKFMEGHVEEFLIRLLTLTEDFEPVWISEECRDSKLDITSDEAVRRINTFRAMYKEIIPIGFDSKGPLPTESGMFFEFGIAWEGLPASDGEKEKHEGMGICQVELEDGEWMIQGVMMPGFEF